MNELMKRFILEVKQDPRFAFYIVETPYRARVTLKESSKNND